MIPLVLRCSKLPWRTLCSLLCSSKATADAVLSSCAGTMDFELTSKEVDLPEFATWLYKHAVLLSSIKEDIFYRPDAAAAANGVAAALSQAAALPDV